MSVLREPGTVLGPEDAGALLTGQTEVLELIAGAAPLREVLTALLRSLERLMDGARCSVLLLDREHGTLHHGAAPHLPDAYTAAIDGLAIGDGAGSCGTAAALNAPVVASDVTSDHRWVAFRGLAEAAGLRSCWSTPIQGRDGRPVGTFAVYHPRPHRPSEREQLLVDRFTHLAAVAIDHAGVLEDLVDSEERFRRSFDDNPIGMAIVGPDRLVVRANHALTGLARRQDLVGHALPGLLTARGRALEERLDDLDDDGTGRIAFTALLHRDAGADVEVEVTVSLLHGRDDAAPQHVVGVLDLTERRAAERHHRARLEAETARRTAEQLSHAKSELLAAVGHEARTPVQAIVGFAELLRTIDLGEARRREALDHIEAAAGHVIELLADVLDLSRLEAGALPLALEPVEVREVVGEVFGLLSARAEAQRVVLSHDLGDDEVRADRRRLRQVLINLVGNAIRHRDAGGHVRVSARPAPSAPDLLVRVEDDGPGIPLDLLPRVFTPFTRAAGPTASPSEGSEESVGLGLGLAHGLSAAMGGDLSVARTGPEGTSMLLRLPRPISPRSPTSR